MPVLTPRLSSYWIHIVTPVHASIARPLAEGLATPVTCEDSRIRDLVPLELTVCREAIRIALESTRRHSVKTYWTGAGSLTPPEWDNAGDAPYAGGTVLGCAYRMELAAIAEQIWDPVARVGGENGWYFGNVLWSVRGWLDRMAGGVGLRRGRRHPVELAAGVTLDFWRVLDVDPPRRLLLRAEMKLPGEATLEFRISPSGDVGTELAQVSRFRPRGLYGILYWYFFLPVHRWLFSGMLRALARKTGRPLLSGPESFDPGKP